MEQNINNQSEVGIIKISDEVIAIIAGLAASEIKGIVSMSSGKVEEWTQKFSGKKNIARGVKVNVEGDSAVIDLFLTVEYGMKIPEIADKVQSNVKKTVESLTGLIVNKVNVNVMNIYVSKITENEISE
ncbi:MAG: Asp23/Gls24 family envelope stress response protein [Clostridiaceae bacterium]